MTTPHDIAVMGSDGALQEVSHDEVRGHIENALKAWMSGKSEHTVRAWHGDLRLFAEFVTGEDVGDTIDAALVLLQLGPMAAEASVADWIADMTERRLQPTTIARRVATLRGFTATMKRFGNTWDLSAVRGPSYSPYARATGPATDVMESKLDELEQRAFASEGGVKALSLDARDYAMLVVLFHTAMRRGTLSALTWSAVHLVGTRPHALGVAKGGKTMRYPLSTRCVVALQHWRAVREENFGAAKNSDAVFCQVSGRCVGEPLGADAIYKRTKYAHHLSGPHGIRHTAATTVFDRSGGDLRMAQDILGHRNAATTQIYMDRQGHAQEDAMRLLAGEEPES